LPPSKFHLVYPTYLLNRLLSFTLFFHWPQQGLFFPPIWFAFRELHKQSGGAFLFPDTRRFAFRLYFFHEGPTPRPSLSRQILFWVCFGVWTPLLAHQSPSFAIINWNSPCFCEGVDFRTFLVFAVLFPRKVSGSLSFFSERVRRIQRVSGTPSFTGISGRLLLYCGSGRTLFSKPEFPAVLLGCAPFRTILLPWVCHLWSGVKYITGPSRF